MLTNKTKNTTHIYNKKTKSQICSTLQQKRNTNTKTGTKKIKPTQHMRVM